MIERLKTPPCCIRLYPPGTIPGHILDGVSALYRSAFTGTARQAKTDATARQIILESLILSDTTLFTYELSTAVVAFTLGSRNGPGEIILPENTVYIPMFAVDQAFRGGPVTARLMVALGNWSIKQGMSHYLFLTDQPEVIKLITSRGGSVVKTLDTRFMISGAIPDLIGLIDKKYALTPLAQGKPHTDESAT